MSFEKPDLAGMTQMHGMTHMQLCDMLAIFSYRHNKMC